MAQVILDKLYQSLDEEEVVAGSFEEPDGRWLVSLHFRDAPNETAIRALVALAADAEIANTLSFETIAPADWVKASLEGLKPVEAGRFIVHGAHDRARIPLNRIGIEIEAALAFGTGHHGTTRGCLLALDALAKRGKRHNVLDVGAGTGVLAIAAARIWHASAQGSDIDPRAVIVARENARLNKVPAVEMIHATGVDAAWFRARGRYDLIFANILLWPLKRLARPIGQLTSSNGRVVLSGLLPEHANAAISAYRHAGLVLERRRLVDGWITLVLRRGS